MFPGDSRYPLVIRVMLDYKAALLRLETEQVQEMGARWLQMERNLQGSFDALALEIQQLQDQGQDVKISKLVRMERYKRLLSQVDEQLDFYTTYADGRIQKGQLDWLKMGIQNAADAIRMYFRTQGRISSAFDILPVSAIESMVGLTGSGSPLRTLLRESWPSAVEGLTTRLIDAIGLGKNPMDTARAMRDGFGVGFNRAINIARTEQLRAYRQSNIEQYRTSKLVQGYKRLSARDTRVCPACLMADDGTVYGLDVPFEEHPQGRCTPVPVVIGMPEVQWQNGQAWFLAQNDAAQRSILGAGRYEAWKGGAFDLADLVKREDNDIWGASLITKSLKELTGG
jgi:SPP1 gp7 family putative phage head morphogenesis protein